MLLRPLLRPTSLPSLTLSSRISALSSSPTSASFSIATRRSSQRNPTTTSLQWSRRPLLFAIGLSAGAAPFVVGRPLARLDTSPSPPADAAPFSSSSYTHSRDAKTPLTKDGKTLNPAAVKQISLGAILGLGTGLVLSAFSTSLTLLLGLGIVIWQVCIHYNESRNQLMLTTMLVCGEKRIQLHPRRSSPALCQGCQSQECHQ